eukprot:CAMPEP_0201490414 /NCGR_PEP_ID=MMETSP0151_2-20130828/26540_1 /ASSEMBLY_ACC=CAM_ASM_000257 /TAXON_ID=200890 /ORGANISM="Paramoeba atlantica, Strain 621/1 / CCAP 1560/9" /LENGTH=332 /DNA_ID=CAMNT_0047876377 /DNA_START=92 /DNA_END=1090 /DNA_ORIENTATION=+
MDSKTESSPSSFEGSPSSFEGSPSCPGCQKPFSADPNFFPKVKNGNYCFRKGIRWHRGCHEKENKIRDLVCETCGEVYAPSQESLFRQHRLIGHKEESKGVLFIPDGMVHEGNLKQVLKENKLLKEKRLECLRICAEWLTSLGISYFLSDGTLLGAFREGKMIDMDIDTDLSIFEKDFVKVFEGASLLPEGYVLDCTSGGVDWSTQLHSPFSGVGAKKLTLIDIRDYSDIVQETQAPETDIYTYTLDGEFFKNNYAKTNQAVHLRRWREDVILPLSSISFEGVEFNSPSKPKEFLEELYGYIGENAYWCPDAKRYFQRPQETSDASSEKEKE